MKKMISLISLLLILSAGMVFANGAQDETSNDQITIGVTYQNMQNEFILSIQDGLRAKAEELGVKVIEQDGQGSAEKQISQVENFIIQEVDAIVLNPFDKDGCAPALDKAVAAGIPVIVVNAMVSNIEKANAYVGSEDVVAGEMEAQYIADLLGGKGNVAIIHGPNGHSAEIQRTIGNKNVLGKYPDIKILAEQTANWSRIEALNLVENWLTSGMELNAILGQNDEMALGAYKAIEAAGKQNDIFVIGIDAIPDALQSVEDGKLVATVFQDARGQGAGAVELAYKVANGESIPDLLNIPFILVTKENLAEFK
ncbi:MAG: hypothetical protein B6241_10710 [Spirochaetaceae bacterium 4572_59]|nr:MAG: hypothetical protein B6241_10710 [Spirochaetaceae bacterium 4572_59]